MDNIFDGDFYLGDTFHLDDQYHKRTEYTRHEHQQTPTIFYLQIWTFAHLFFYLDMEFLGLFGVFVDF